MKMKDVDFAAGLITAIGAINWGLVGAFNLDLVKTILGTSDVLVQLAYIVVGVSGLYMLYKMLGKGKK